MKALITIHELQSRLAWQDVAEYSFLPDCRRFTVLPRQKAHPDESADQRQNLRRAIALARTLISRARHLLVNAAAVYFTGQTSRVRRRATAIGYIARPHP